jgi:hypothetical protein
MDSVHLYGPCTALVNDPRVWPRAALSSLCRLGGSTVLKSASNCCADSTFADLASNAIGPGTDTSGAAAFHDSAMNNIDAGPGGGAVALHGPNAAALLDNTTFTNVKEFPVVSDTAPLPSVAGANVNAAANSAAGANGAMGQQESMVGVYSNKDVMSVQDSAGNAVPPQPLKNAPKGLFLAAGDPWFTNVQQVRGSAARAIHCPISHIERRGGCIVASA